MTEREKYIWDSGYDAGYNFGKIESEKGDAILFFTGATIASALFLLVNWL